MRSVDLYLSRVPVAANRTTVRPILQFRVQRHCSSEARWGALFGSGLRQMYAKYTHIRGLPKDAHIGPRNQWLWAEPVIVLLEVALVMFHFYKHLCSGLWAPFRGCTFQRPTARRSAQSFVN